MEKHVGMYLGEWRIISLCCLPTGDFGLIMAEKIILCVQAFRKHATESLDPRVRWKSMSDFTPVEGEFSFCCLATGDSCLIAAEKIILCVQAFRKQATECPDPWL